MPVSTRADRHQLRGLVGGTRRTKRPCRSALCGPVWGRALTEPCCAGAQGPGSVCIVAFQYLHAGQQCAFVAGAFGGSLLLGPVPEAAAGLGAKAVLGN